MTSSQLAENLWNIKQQVNAACAKAGRDPKSVKILLATKTVPAETVLHAYQLGYTLVGENKANELKAKQALIPNTPLEWHFIGHLQSNKAKDVLPICTLIHSLDRLSLAEAIDKRATKPTSVLIEVNTSGEPAKSGMPPEQAVDFCRSLAQFKNIKVKGLMTMAPADGNEQDSRRCFKTLKKLSEEIAKLQLPHCSMDELSMGMSQDFALAIEEGATIIRIGSLAFGERVETRIE